MHSALSEILASINVLDPLPRVAVSVLELAKQPEVDPHELRQVLQTDAGIASKVLRMSNSAAIAGRLEVVSLNEACTRLGTRVRIDRVMTSCAEHDFMGVGQARGSTHRMQWEESLSNAISARAIASIDGQIDRHRAYTLGLLQNIGHVAMDRFLAVKRDRIRLLVEEDGRDPLDAEREVLGIDHAEVGARMAELWGLPDVLIDGIRFHHAPRFAAAAAELAATGGLAEAITWEVLGETGTAALAYGTAPATVRMIAIDLDGFVSVRETLRAELREQRVLVEG